MSYTECPGGVLYPQLPQIRDRVFVQREVWKTGLKPARRLGVVTP
jgi:hypothetical protein